MTKSLVEWWTSKTIPPKIVSKVTKSIESEDDVLQYVKSRLGSKNSKKEIENGIKSELTNQNGYFMKIIVEMIYK